MKTEARTRMIENNQSETEMLFWELMAEPPYPAMTQEQIVRELSSRVEGDMFDTGINEKQLKKLVKDHATGPLRTKVGGKARRRTY